MAYILQSSNSIGAGVRVTLTNGVDTYGELAGVSVATTDGSTAIQSTVGATDSMQINGQVVGGVGISFTSSNSYLQLINTSTGYIAGLSGDAIDSKGATLITNYGQIVGNNEGVSLHYGWVYNYGTISSTTGDVAIAFATQGTVFNFGTLIGVDGVNFGNAPGGNFLYNAGTIRTDFGIVDNAQSGVDTIVNAGTIASQDSAFVAVGQAQVHFTNTGSIVGAVDFGLAANVFDSTLGQVFGTITGGGGADTIVGGTNGGTIIGGAGNDTLYANRTQPAAEAAATTTLDAGTGVNALYGGSAFTTFVAGNSSGGYNQIWGGASKMTDVAGYASNTLSFATASHGVYVDLLSGHDAYVGNTTDWSGSGVFEDSIVNVPNVIGSGHGDLIQADNGIDRVTGGTGADALYAGNGQDTFVYNGYADSNLVSGYDTIVGFRLATDKIDLSAMHTNASHLAMSTAGTSNTLYVETTPGIFNSATDLALIVNTTTTGGLHASDFVF
jgi:hypothetical protein